VFVLAGRAVGAAAHSEFEFALVEVLVKFAPFMFGGSAVFGFGAHQAPTVEEGSVVRIMSSWKTAR
jgi:hypothetical protein